MIAKNNLDALRNNLSENEAFLILSEENRFYLTGFHSSNGFCFITREKCIFGTDFRYIEAALRSVKGFAVTEEKSRRSDLISELSKQNGITKINLEAEHTSVSLFNAYKDKLEGIEIAADGRLDKMLLEYRRIKTEEEIEFISKAASVSDKAFLELLPFIKVGVTEKELAARLEYLLKKNGGDGLAFETIAVSGENSSKPHGEPGDRIINNGDFITLDFGATYRGYCSDITRTVAVGNITDEMKKIYDSVLKAQTEALKHIRPGAVCKDIDAVARKIITDAGYGDAFGHGLGHSLGIEIHESPSLSPSCDEVLKENTVITCEPGIYLKEKFGVRIEDTVLVTKEGCIPLNKVTKELIIL